MERVPENDGGANCHRRHEDGTEGRPRIHTLDNSVQSSRVDVKQQSPLEPIFLTRSFYVIINDMRILSGWKDIATHMHQSVRTVQRWELVGLPIHRPKAGPRGQVIAFAEELDAWAEAAPLRAIETAAELRAKVAKLEQKLQGLKRQLAVKGAAQSTRIAHNRGAAAPGSRQQSSRASDSSCGDESWFQTYKSP